VSLGTRRLPSGGAVSSGRTRAEEPVSSVLLRRRTS
jgi:hypothetical protein